METSPTVIYQQLVEIAGMSGEERQQTMAVLHKSVLEVYLNTLRHMTEEVALSPSADERTKIQVVGHVMEWERYIILTVGEFLSGVTVPQFSKRKGYINQDGEVKEFASFDAFNAFQAEKHVTWSWEQVRDMAIDTATTVYTLYTTPQLMTPERMAGTPLFAWNLPTGEKIEVPAGLFFWMVAVEHIVGEHGHDLGW